MGGGGSLSEPLPDIFVTESNAVRSESEAAHWSPVLEVLDEHERDRLLDENERLARRRRRGGDLASDISFTGRMFRERRGRGGYGGGADGATEQELDDLLGPDDDEDYGAAGGVDRGDDGYRAYYRRQVPNTPQVNGKEAKPFVFGPRQNYRDFENRASRVVGAYKRANTTLSRT